MRLRFERQPETDYGLLAGEPQEAIVELAESEDGYTLACGELRLELLRQPLRLRFSAGGRTLLASADDRTIRGDLRFMPFACTPEAWLAALALKSSEAIYGLGEKFGGLNRRGQLVTNWNRDAIGVNAEISYKNTPFAWSTAGWGLYVHTPARVTHGAGYAPWSHRTYVLKVDDPNLDLFLFAGETPAAIVERYTWLTGRAPELPRWSYGMWMSKAFYATAGELQEVAGKLRERRIPCDVITLDGRAWHKPETRFDFAWDPERYPDPAGFVAGLRQQHHLRLCLWEYPYLSTRNPLFAELDAKGYFLKNPDGSTYIHRWFPPPMDTLVPHLQPSAIIDFTNPEAYAWFRDMHRPLIEMGVAVMKTDYGEAVPEEVVGCNGDRGRRLHNAYALLYNRCTYEAFERYSPDGGIVWGRAAWTGSQACPLQWGGDPQSDWEGLAGSIRGGLSWGMSGTPYYAHDIGGFYGAQVGQVLGSGKADPELYVRWAQAGIMASHTRFHGVGPREPWEYGEEVEGIVRSWLGWRYRLIPYLEACAAEAHQTGLPLMRAMPLAFPDDPAAWAFETQYLLGPALLVCPVLQAGGAVRVYLPAGAWYDLWTGERLEGGRVIEQVMPLERIPLYGREGSTLLLGPAAQHTGELGPDTPVESITFGTSVFKLEL